MSKNRATQEIKQKRLEEVLELRGKGKLRFQVLTELAKRWDTNERHVQYYWDKCNQIIKDGFSDEDLINSYTYIRDRNIDENPAIAVKCNDGIAKLKKGGYTTEIVFKIEHTPEDDETERG